MSGTALKNGASLAQFSALEDNYWRSEFRNARNESLAIQKYAKAEMDAFQNSNGVDADLSVNQYFNSGGEYLTYVAGVTGSNILTGGTPSGNASCANPEAAFDGNTGTYFNSGQINYGNLTYDLGSGNAKAAVKMRLWLQNFDGVQNRRLLDFKLQGSNNGTDWTTVLNTQTAATCDAWQEFDFEETASYRYWRLYDCTSGSGGNYIIVNEWQLISPSTAEEKNFTLVTPAIEAATKPTKGKIILWVAPQESIVLNTDIKAYISTDDGAHYDEVEIVDRGAYTPTTQYLYEGEADLTDRNDQTLRFKVETLNHKDVRLYGIVKGWR